MSDTPRTDAFLNEKSVELWGPGGDQVWIGFVRQLERELTAAQAAVKRRDEVIEAVIVAGPEFCPAGMTCGTLQCTDCWRNWVDAKLKEGVK